MNYITRIYKAIRSLFRPKRIKLLGRVGLHFYNEGKTYFVDSELLSSKDFEIVIYKDIYLIKNNSKILLSNEIQKEILIKTKLELENMGLRVLIHNDFTL
jgi:hypothetical protein